MPLLLIFVVIPIVEMWLLIKIGSQIGALTTIALVFLTAMIGLALLRRQGFSTLMRANQKMESGQIPAQEIVDGLFLAVGGALLLTPGFITDALGFICLIPGLRKLVLGRFIQGMLQRQGAGFQFYYSSRQSGAKRSAPEDDAIEGEYREERDRNDPRLP